ncbi:hypothetical protein F7725_006533 [Dissostichus mawsoni]|uniref:Proteasome assembly chaperone 1 n=1 Tax=Dissostichus mawsoni TaxID=36200 RepID=A0A7J5XUU9_DISMA|nr:hypothetical protein F7725_006533 [Dissostichus mawsoni]
MATFFGEVLSVYSRAVEEDEEDLDENEEDAEIRRELEEKREVNLHWSPEVSESLKSGNKLPCSDFILALGHNAARFLSVYALTSENWDALGRASVWNERSGGSPARSRPVLICQVTCYLAEDQLFQWTEKTTDYLSSSSAPFLRSLHSAAFSGKPVCKSLEQPNIVHRIPSVVYQCYSDVIGPDSVTMETFKPTLTNLGKSIKLDPSPSADILRKIVRTTNIQSNLYI